MDDELEERDSAESSPRIARVRVRNAWKNVLRAEASLGPSHPLTNDLTSVSATLLAVLQQLEQPEGGA